MNAGQIARRIASLSITVNDTLTGLLFVIATANITMQFGAKPLFENVSVKFNNGNRYGLIGLDSSVGRAED